MSAPDALMLLAPGCPHCPGVLEALARLLKEGVIGRLEAVNVAVHPQAAAALGVRGVPWTRVGPYVIEGATTPDELRRWAEAGESEEALAAYCLENLKSGRRARVEALARERPQRLLALTRLLADGEAGMAVRLGIGAVLEELQGSGLTAVMVPGLAALARAGDALTRADACHYLSLIGGAPAIAALRACRDDPDPQVREVVAEALEELETGD
jgi:thiol-disulfide isomerase/thioredoxin